MIIIINKLQIDGKRFCENNVTGSNFGGRCGLMPSPRPSPTGRGRRARTVGRVSAAPPGGGQKRVSIAEASFSSSSSLSSQLRHGSVIDWP